MDQEVVCRTLVLNLIFRCASRSLALFLASLIEINQQIPKECQERSCSKASHLGTVMKFFTYWAGLKVDTLRVPARDTMKVRWHLGLNRWLRHRSLYI